MLLFRWFKWVFFQDWIQGISIDQDGKGRADGSGSLNARASAAAEDGKREAELQAQYVIVPLGDEAQIVSCSICKETLASEFLEDDEDWVWKNAVKKDDKVRFFNSSLFVQILISGIIDISCDLSCPGSFIDEEQLWSEAMDWEIKWQSIYYYSWGSINQYSSGLQSTSPPTSLRASLESISIKGTIRKVDDHEDLKSTDEKDLPPLKKIA